MNESKSFTIDPKKLRLVLTRTFRILQENSLRSSVIMSSARVEWLIEEICEKHLPVISGRAHVARASALFEMGIIDETARDLIKHLADVRNEFAHRDEEFDLTDPIVRPHFRNFLGKARKCFGDDRLISDFCIISNDLLTLRKQPTLERNWFEPENRQLIIYAGFLQIFLLAVLTFDQPKPRLFRCAAIKIHVNKPLPPIASG
jgi:hypothetical protein